MRKLKNEELNRMDPLQFKASSKMPWVIVLDNIRSMHNVGAAFRTADAFRVTKIILTGITAQPPHREINKSALGATESVDWVYFENSLDALTHLKSEGYQIIAIEQADQSTSLELFTPNKQEKYAFFFGNEVFGVTDQVVRKADFCLEIPQFGTKHSLNISVSIGIVIWDFFQKSNHRS
jgi:23S rRNA (guanosine2251-2'-O)-methyltransferase